MKIFDRIKPALKRWSTWLNAAGLTILTAVSFDPTIAMLIFNMLPAPLAMLLPGRWLLTVSIPIYLLYVIHLLVKKPAPCQ